MLILLHCNRGHFPLFISNGWLSPWRFYLCHRFAVIFSPFGSSSDVPAREHLIPPSAFASRLNCLPQPITFLHSPAPSTGERLPRVVDLNLRL